MHLITALAAGISGAGDGMARLYARGTSQAAYWYPAFEGGAVSYAPVLLDSNGGATVYVNQLVDVVVTDPEGDEVRRFTAGVSAPGVEVISRSFTGVDYETGASGTSKPTTLQSALDRLYTSFGAADGNVLVGGSALTMQAALSGSALYYNVKAAGYNAAGNGTTDDTSAIQAAINAANAAGGGTVFFPPGTYRITAALSLPGTVCLLGAGASASSIRMDHALNNSISIASASTLNYQTISGLRIAPSQTNTGALLACGASLVALINCSLGDTVNTAGQCITTTAGGQVVVTLSVVSCTGATGRCFVGAGLLATDAIFLQAFAGAYAPVDGVIVCAAILMKGCTIATASASGTYDLIHYDGPGTGLVFGNFFNPGLGTVTAIAIDSYLNAGAAAFHESGNSFTSSSSTHLPYRYTVSVLALQRVTLATRERLHVTTSLAASGTLRSDLYGSVHVQLTTNAAMVLTLNEAPEGACLDLVIDNDSGGVSGSISFSANVRTVAGSTLAAGEIDVYRFKSISVDGTLQWALVAQQQGL